MIESVEPLAFSVWPLILSGPNALKKSSDFCWPP
jgi:hypothetical protein